jgi:hypothetical protein
MPKFWLGLGSVHATDHDVALLLSYIAMAISIKYAPGDAV